jgi:hypothetical protein
VVANHARRRRQREAQERDHRAAGVEPPRYAPETGADEVGRSGRGRNGAAEAPKSIKAPLSETGRPSRPKAIPTPIARLPSCHPRVAIGHSRSFVRPERPCCPRSASPPPPPPAARSPSRPPARPPAPPAKTQILAPDHRGPSCAVAIGNVDMCMSGPLSARLCAAGFAGAGTMTQTIFDPPEALKSVHILNTPRPISRGRDVLQYARARPHNPGLCAPCAPPLSELPEARQNALNAENLGNMTPRSRDQ